MSRITLPTAFTWDSIAADYPEASLSVLNATLSAALSAEANLATDKDRGPITRWLAQAFGDPRSTKLVVANRLPLKPTDPSPFWPALQSIVDEGSTLVRGKTSTDVAEITGVQQAAWLTLQRLVILVSSGGDAYWEPEDGSERMYWWVRIDDANESLPAWWGEGTWGELPNQITTESDGNYVLCCQDANSPPFAASKIVSLYTAGKTLKTNAEIQALLPQSESP